MFKKIKLLAVLFLIISFTACSNEEKSTDKIDLTGMDIKISSRLGDDPFLFEYADLAELENKAKETAASLIEESLETINEGFFTNVIITFSYKNGKALISEFYLLNTRDDYIEGKIADDEATQTFYAPSSAALLLVLDNYVNGSNCPQGYTMVNSCSNTGNTKGCVGGAVESYLSSNISSVGDCANIQFKVGLLNTRVCGKTC